jgi:O-antigen ligase
MPPQLALFLCTAFVLCLLHLERRHSQGVSAATWIPTLWMIAVAGKPVGTWLGIAGTAETGSAPDRLVLTSLCVAGVIVVVVRRFKWGGALRQHWWLVLLLAYMFLSTMWSDITLIALKRCLRQSIVVIMALVVMSERNPRQAFESIVRRSAYVLIPYSLLLIKYYQHLGVEYTRYSGVQMWVGATVHKNTLGRLCVISAFFLLWELYRRWRHESPAVGKYQTMADVSVLAIAVHLLRGADGVYSATSIGTMAVGIAVFMGLLRLRRARHTLPQPVLLGMVFLLFAFGTSAPFLGGTNVAVFSSSFGRNETLTGRTDTWAELVPVVKQQPMLGRGVGSFWTTERKEFYQMDHGHNGYLDVLLELGVVGLGLNLIWLLSCARQLHRTLAEDYLWGSLGICLLLMLLVYNTTESVLGDLSTQLTALVVLAAFAVPLVPVPAPRRRTALVSPGAPSQPDRLLHAGSPARMMQPESLQPSRRPRGRRSRGAHAPYDGVGPSRRPLKS